jgi:hypothetical protein
MKENGGSASPAGRAARLRQRRARAFIGGQCRRCRRDLSRSWWRTPITSRGVPGRKTSQRCSCRQGGIIGADRHRDHSVDARDLPRQRKLSVMGQKRRAQAGDASMSASIASMRSSRRAIQKARRPGDKAGEEGRFASPSSSSIPTFRGFDAAVEYDRWARGVRLATRPRRSISPRRDDHYRSSSRSRRSSLPSAAWGVPSPA